MRIKPIDAFCFLTPQILLTVHCTCRYPSSLLPYPSFLSLYSLNIPVHLSAADCGRPKYLIHGRVTFNSTSFSSVAEYKCSEGYETTSTTLRATCQMTCLDRVVDRGYCKIAKPFWSSDPPECTGVFKMMFDCLMSLFSRPEIIFERSKFKNLSSL